MRILVGSDTAITSPPFVGADGETPTACDSDPTVTVVDHAGVAMSAPTAELVDGADGVYKVKLTHGEHAARLDILTITWTGTVDGDTQVLVNEVDVVGAFYATLPSIRQMDGMEDPNKYPVAELRRVRDIFEGVAERYRGVSYVPRLKVEAVKGGAWCSTSTFLVDELYPRALRSITVGETTADLTGWLFNDYGLLYNDVASVSWGAGETARIAYEYGRDRPPEAIADACREYVRSTLLKSTSGVDRDIIWQSFDGGPTNRYSTPDWAAGRPTGWIDVDRLLNSVLDERHLQLQ
jgi:hypothetical protein